MRDEMKLWIADENAGVGTPRGDSYDLNDETERAAFFAELNALQSALQEAETERAEYENQASQQRDIAAGWRARTEMAETERDAAKALALQGMDWLIERVFRGGIEYSLNPTGRDYVARCRAFGLYAYGTSEDEARTRLREAANLMRDTYLARSLTPSQTEEAGT